MPDATRVIIPGGTGSIPDDEWHRKAVRIVLTGTHEMKLKAGTPCGPLVREIAAALLSADRAAREECAKIADDEDGVFTDYGEDRNNAVAQRTSSRIAASIRGSQP